MVANTERPLLLPSGQGGAEHFIDLAGQHALDSTAGGSTVIFAAGRAASVNTRQLLSVLVVVIGLDDEAKERIYRYLFSIQSITHRLRPVILTDGDDLRGIRRYGWMTEHVMSRTAYESLSLTPQWESWVVDRIRSSAARLDVGCLLVCSDAGVTFSQHEALMHRMKQKIPFTLTRF